MGLKINASYDEVNEAVMAKEDFDEEIYKAFNMYNLLITLAQDRKDIHRDLFYNWSSNPSKELASEK